MHQVKKFGVFQTAKVLAIIYLILYAVLMVPAGLFMVIFGAVAGFPTEVPFAFSGLGIILMLLPVFYAVLMFVITAIGCLVYNLLSDKMGGIEVELKETANEPEF